jgi:type II secretory pathway pseudopilin PulG
MKKFLTLTVGLLALGFLFVTAQETSRAQIQAQEKAQVKTQAQAQAKTQVKSQFRHQNRIGFIDENGDGINDLARDADGDGIPNCQDPDWTRPLDGSGAKTQAGKGAVAADATGAAGTGRAYQLARDDDGDGIPNGQDPDWTRPLDGSGYKGQHKFAKASFRTGMTGAARMSGAGACDGTGPKGTAQRKGRR